MKKKKVGCCLAFALPFVLFVLAYLLYWIMRLFGLSYYGTVVDLDAADPKTCSIVNTLLFGGESNQWIQLERCSLVKGRDAMLYGSGRIPAGRLPSFTNTIGAAFESVEKERCSGDSNKAVPWYGFGGEELAGGWENPCTLLFILRESNSEVRVRFMNFGDRKGEFPKAFWDIVNQRERREAWCF